MAARYAEAEQRMIERVARLAAAGLETPDDLADRLRTLRDLRAEGARIAADLADPQAVARIMAIAQADGTQAALAQLGIGATRANSSAISTMGPVTGLPAAFKIAFLISACVVMVFPSVVVVFSFSVRACRGQSCRQVSLFHPLE
jgi:uncharacterized membrane protein